MNFSKVEKSSLIKFQYQTFYTKLSIICFNKTFYQKLSVKKFLEKVSIKTLHTNPKNPDNSLADTNWPKYLMVKPTPVTCH